MKQSIKVTGQVHRSGKTLLETEDFNEKLMQLHFFNQVKDFINNSYANSSI